MTMFFLRCFLCAALAGWFVSCGSTDQFYRLSASEGAATGSSAGVSVSVGPVSLPAYIDRAELVFQNGTNEFPVPSNVRWLGSLPENISRVLAENLGHVLHSSRVRSSLETGFTPRYQVALDVRQFHGISGREAILDVSWRILSGGEVLSRQSALFHEPIVGDGYGPLVAAESRLLEQCALAIAQSLP
ncbi:hypothetical protein BH20VER3_BH20VER3_23400 [soil metagenome]